MIDIKNVGVNNRQDWSGAMYRDQPVPDIELDDWDTVTGDGID